MRVSRKRIRRGLVAFLRLSWEDKCLAVEAIFTTAATRFRLLRRPLETEFDRLGVLQAESPYRDSPKIAATIGKRLQSVRYYTWWRCGCLEQAMAGYQMLRRRGIPSTINVGVNKSGDLMEAHAWLRCGNEILTGGEQKEDYVSILTLSQPPS